ncbi:MAG: RNA polymerase sigma factor [Pirellulales bacterium]|nr:RNA polymerase sigma factor [Pirellulales bacterium]
MKPIPQVNQSDSQEVSQLTLRELFDAEESSLVRYAYSLTGRRSVAEEIVQEVFLQLHAHWNDVASPRAWLFRSVRNRAYNHNRDHQREILTGKDHHSQSTNTSNETPEVLLMRREAVAEVRVILEELDEDDRQLVKLKYFENLKYSDISTQTGLSISNVGFRLHRILKELAKKLRRLGVEELS